MKMPEWRHWHRFSVFFVNFEQILHTISLLSLNKETHAGNIIAKSNHYTKNEVFH